MLIFFPGRGVTTISDSLCSNEMALAARTIAMETLNRMSDVVLPQGIEQADVHYQISPLEEGGGSALHGLPMVLSIITAMAGIDTPETEAYIGEVGTVGGVISIADGGLMYAKRPEGLDEGVSKLIVPLANRDSIKRLYNEGLSEEDKIEVRGVKTVEEAVRALKH